MTGLRTGLLDLIFSFCLSTANQAIESFYHYENTPIQIYTENFTTKKIKKVSDKNSDFFHISTQNIDCGYSLEPPRRGSPIAYPQSSV